MTWLNRGFKLRHKFTKEKDMKAEAIQALELFKQQHLAREVEVPTEDIVSSSHSVSQIKENQMANEPRKIDLSHLRYPVEVAHPPEPSKKKGVNFNYPDHYKPLKDRIMSALNNGCRTAESVATYCKEEVKLVNLQLGRWVSRGLIGRKVSATGITRYYPHDLAKEMGILTAPQPIHRKGKKAKPITKATTKPEVDSRQMDLFKDTPAPTTKITQAEAFVLRGETVGIADKSNAKEEKYIEFLEKRMVEWQTECRKMAKQLTELENQVVQARAEVVKVNQTRDVTSEVTEVMKEVMELRATVAYLESKLFGRK
jgi:hypothetical protein